MSPAYTLSPSPSMTAREATRLPNMALALTANEIQDGGQTPGPFEEMGHRSTGETGYAAAAPRKREREKKRRWVWTIGQDEDDDDNNNKLAGAVVASRAESVKKRARVGDDVPQFTYEEPAISHRQMAVG